MEWAKLLLCIFSLAHLDTVLCTTKCPTDIRGYYGREGIISCSIDHDFQKVYWFNETNPDTAFIRREHGTVSKNEEYDILSDGSLVIKNITFSNDQQYTLVLVSGDTHDPAVFVNFSVIGCDKICPPENGQVNQNASWAQFTCDDGFHLSKEGSNTIECLCESGVTHNCSWSDLRPTCCRRNVINECSTTTTNVFSTTTHTTKAPERSTAMPDIAPDPPWNVHKAVVAVVAVLAVVVVVAIIEAIVIFLLCTKLSRKCNAGDEDRNVVANPSNKDDVSETSRNKEDNPTAAENPKNPMGTNRGLSNAKGGLSTNADERAENESIEMKERNQPGSDESSKLLRKLSSNKQEESDSAENV